MTAAALLVASTLALAAPGPAAAAPATSADRSRGGPALALRVGWGPSLGDLARDVSMSEVTGGQVPIQLDVLWRVGPLSAGAYGSYGFGFGGRCDTCRASVVRVGLEAMLSWRLLDHLEGWGGLGAGYEWATRHRTDAGAEVTTAYRGFELLSLQAGADLHLHRRFAVGPWALLALGRYRTVHLSTEYASAEAAVPTQATHAWLLVGLRAVVEL